jgi:hypothetical protein
LLPILVPARNKSSSAVTKMMSINSISLYVMVAFSYFHRCESWKYCDGWDETRDDFGVKSFVVEPRSLSSVHFKLKGTPVVSIGRGGGEFIPKIKLVVYETESEKKLYSDTKDLCDFTDCSLKQDRNAVIKVRLGDIGATLKRGVYYSGEITVIEKCGSDVTCVTDKFCIAKNSDELVNEDKKNKETDKKEKKDMKEKKDKNTEDEVLEDPDPIIADPIVF